MTFWKIKANLSAKVSPRDGLKKKIINVGRTQVRRPPAPGTRRSSTAAGRTPCDASPVSQPARVPLEDSSKALPGPQVPARGEAGALQPLGEMGLAPRSRAPPKGGVLVFIYSAARGIHSTLSISIT